MDLQGIFKDFISYRSGKSGHSGTVVLKKPPQPCQVSNGATDNFSDSSVAFPRSLRRNLKAGMYSMR